MYLTMHNLFAVMTFALIVTASLDRCAGQQQGRVHDFRQPAAQFTNTLEGVRQATPSRLGNELLTDLRSKQNDTTVIEPPVKRHQAPAPHQPRTLNADALSKVQQTISSQSTARRAQSFFDSDQPPPVVVVWMNSDLQTSLLSEGQLKQWMQSIPEHDNLTQKTPGNNWQPNPESRVGLVSHTQTEQESPLGFSSPTQQIDDFNLRLREIRQRLESKKKQIAADESIDSTSKSDMGNLLGLAGDWIARAESDLTAFQKETEAEAKFDSNLRIRELELVKEKKLASSLLSSKLDLLPSVRSEAINVLQKWLKDDEALLLSSTDKRNEVREQISTRDQRVTELPGLQRRNAKEEDEAKRLITELDGQPDDLNRSLQKLRFEAKFLSLEITEKSLKLESRRREQDGRILPLELEELTLRIRRIKTKLEELRGRSDKLRDEELNARREAARNALNEELTQSTPQLKELAKFNIDLVIQKKELAKKNDELEQELINVKQLQSELDESQKQIEHQINTLGPTASGIRLVEHRRSLISTGKSQNRLLELKDRLQHKQTRKLVLKERLEQLVLGDTFELEVLAAVEAQVTEHVKRQTAVDVAADLLETQKKYGTDLLAVFEDNIQKLSQLEAAHRTLIAEVRNAKAFSDENALWVRNSKPIEFNDLNLCRAGLQSVITSDQWQGLGDHAYETFQKRPYDAGLLALVIGSLLVVRRRLRWSHD